MLAVALAIGLVATFALAAACADDDDESTDAGDDRIQVLTSLPLFADFVRNVGGDRVNVTSLLPPGADPHTWEPAPQDVTKIGDADIVFVNGLSLETSAINIIEPNMGDGVLLVELAEEADVEVHEGDEHEEDEHEGDEHEGEEHADEETDGGDHEGEEDGHDHSEGDPHLWMDPANVIAYAGVIRDHLAEIDPDGETAYTANHDAYVAEIEEANAYLEEAVADVPEENRKLITTHDAFGYLAEHIGFEIAAFVSEGPGQDASPGDIRAIVEAVEEGGVPAVFNEPQIQSDSEILEQVADDTGAEICTLYSDSLDDDVSTYVEMVHFNADEIARCLA